MSEVEETDSAVSPGDPLEKSDDAQIESSDPTDDSPVEAEPLTVENLVAALEAVTVERDQHLDHLQRVSAEFANFRRQTDKRNTEFAAQAGARLAEALLPVLDACDAAAQQEVEGIEAISDQLKAVLQRQGLEVIAEESEGFDPNRHEAAISEPGDDSQTAPIVAEVLRTGYAWNGRVLRAAMVKVKG